MFNFKNKDKYVYVLYEHLDVYESLVGIFDDVKKIPRKIRGVDTRDTKEIREKIHDIEDMETATKNCIISFIEKNGLLFNLDDKRNAK